MLKLLYFLIVNCVPCDYSLRTAGYKNWKDYQTSAKAPNKEEQTPGQASCQVSFSDTMINNAQDFVQSTSN